MGAGKRIDRFAVQSFGVSVPPRSPACLTAELRWPLCGHPTRAVHAPHPTGVCDLVCFLIGGDASASAPRLDRVGIQPKMVCDSGVGHAGPAHHLDPFPARQNPR